MCPVSRASVVIASTSGSWVEREERERHAARGGRARRGRAAAPACRARRGTARRTASIFSTPEALANSASTSSCMPLTTKKNGMKTPKRDRGELRVERRDLALLEHLARDQARPRSRRAAGRGRARTRAARARTRARRSSARRAASSSRACARTAAASARTSAPRPRATPTASADERDQDQPRCGRRCPVERISVTSRIGPNSPTAPAASR